MIPSPFNSGTDHSAAKLNGEGGFTHSEIAGSKPAHGSPTLIAACHVLHRLYMPRHSPNALTSRLRVHITNDNTGPAGKPDNHSACVAMAYMWIIMLSLIISIICNNRVIDPKIDIRVATASIKKTHSQCQRGAIAPFHGRSHKSLSSSLEYGKPTQPTANAVGIGGAYRDRTDDLMLAKQLLSQLS